MNANPTVATPQVPVLSYPDGISALYLYGVLNVDTAQALGIKNLNDPTLPRKNWAATVDEDGNPVDDSVPNLFYTLKTAPQGATSQFVMPAKMIPFTTIPGQATTINLPAAAASYPEYEIVPIGAYENDGGSALPVNSAYFSTLDQAKQMAALIGGDPATIMEYQPAAGPSQYEYVYAPGETRRYYVFKDSVGDQQVAGIMLAQINYFGVGRPGSFAKTPNGWEWTPAPIPAPAPFPGPMFPMPMRHLLKGESIISVSAGMSQMLDGPATA